VLSLLGDSGSGKTTLAVRLVSTWTSRGLRVGYVKHASHGFEMDRPGKDTDRVAAAGADGVAVTGPGGFAYLERGDPRDPADVVARCFRDRDVVVLEGFRSHGFPAVVVVGPEDPAPARERTRGRVLAVLAPRAPRAPAARARAAGTPRTFVFGREAALARHVEVVLGLRARGRGAAGRIVTRGSRRVP
jgi:molybdopterin-guanine dinucleotide biosynthesis protein MobB